MRLFQVDLNSHGRNNLSKINHLPLLDRPREKAFRYGIDKLSDHELLALLIESGTKEESAVDIAYRIISASNGLVYLFQKPFSDLTSFKGVGNAKAIKIAASFEIAKRLMIASEEKPYVLKGEEIAEKYIKVLNGLTQESMYLVILDKKKKIIHETNMYRGNESSLNTSYRQILKEVIIHNGSYFYIVHNHPSGDVLPSEEDIFFTSGIIHESKKLKLKMLDHFIIGKGQYYSFLHSKMVII